MTYIAIVDMDQPSHHVFVGIENEKDFNLAEFDTIQEIKTLPRRIL